MPENTILSIHNINKTYPGVTALDNVSMTVSRGEVHALLGENGAGKSTLIKVLSGAIKPDSGEIIFDGKKLSDTSPKSRQEAGIGVIYQEFNLVPALTVADNIFLGAEIRKGIVVNRREQNKRTSELLQSLKIDIDPKIEVRRLSVAYQQVVEIAKAVAKNVKLLIMDEPSAPLTTQEVEAMFALVRRLQASGVTIIYISHRMDELFEIADRVTVMRDGKYISTRITAETNIDELVQLEVGRQLSDTYPQRSKTPELSAPPALEARNICQGGFLKCISFQLRKGEILGVSGLVGAGRTELARVLFGADRINSGEIIIHGNQVKIKKPQDAIKQGISLIPEDRKRQGLLLEMNVGENISLANIKKLSSRFVVNRQNEQDIIKRHIESLRIKTPSRKQKTLHLSGGNQQKVVLAKWLATDSDILLFDEPTRGIDVGAKQEIYRLIIDLADAGASILLISSDMPEVLGLSDRIMVMRDGAIAGILERGEATQSLILTLAAGGKQT